jgi:hypothetical protein
MSTHGEVEVQLHLTLALDKADNQVQALAPLPQGILLPVPIGEFTYLS